MELIVSILNHIKELFSDNMIFGLGILLFTGYFFGKIAEYFRLPPITGYILAGLVMGESVIGIIHHDLAIHFNAVTEVALGLIAITIGAEFEFGRLRRIGKTIIIIAFFEIFFAFFAVMGALLLAGLELQYALLLGAVATTTAPAATVIIIRELRVRGEFVDYLYGVVALGVTISVILFSIIFALITPMLSSSSSYENTYMFSLILNAFLSLFFSALFGIAGGVFLHFIIRKKHELNEIFIISVAVIFIITSITIALGLSLLIANMVLGVIVVNLSGNNRRIFILLEPVTPPLFALFHILAGTELKFSVFLTGSVVLFGIVYMFSRFMGKFGGTYTACTLLKAPAKIKNNLGFCLFPQAGMAIGLALLVQTSPVMTAAPMVVQDKLFMIVNIVLVSIFINELIWPAIARFGIKRGVGK